MARIAYLECTRCGQHLSADTPQTVCPADGGSLYVRYDFGGPIARPTHAPGPSASLWRYAAVLPDIEPVSLGEP